MRKRVFVRQLSNRVEESKELERRGDGDRHRSLANKAWLIARVSREREGRPIRPPGQAPSWKLPVSTSSARSSPVSVELAYARALRRDLSNSRDSALTNEVRSHHLRLRAFRSFITIIFCASVCWNVSAIDAYYTYWLYALLCCSTICAIFISWGNASVVRMYRCNFL